MKILFLTKNFPPHIGGMEAVAYNMYKELGKEFEIYFVGPTSAKAYVDSNAKNYFCDCIDINSFLKCITVEAENICRSQIIDFVFCTALTTSICAARIKKVNKSIKCISYIHGLDISIVDLLEDCDYLEALNSVDFFIANSNFTRKYFLDVTGVKTNVSIVPPGIEMPNSCNQVNLIKQKYNIKENHKLLLTVGRLIPRKGIVQFITNSFKEIVSRYQNITYIIIGSEAKNSISKYDMTKNDIYNAAEEIGCRDNIIVVDNVSSNELAQLYLESDIFVYPTLQMGNDFEGFGLVTIEAAAYGLPTIGFAAAGVTDAVSSASGILLAPQDYKGLSDTIVAYLEHNISKISALSCKSHASKFDTKLMGAKLIQEILAL